MTGITIEGEFYDLYELVESIYRMTYEAEDVTDAYYGVKNRLLGVCYDIRHAYMGDREVVLKENGMNKELMKWHEMVVPTQNLYYKVNVLFPEALFIASAVPRMFIYAARFYGERKAKKDSILPKIPYSDFYRDKANLEVLCSGIWQALNDAIGQSETEKLMRQLEDSYEDYRDYATHYIDKCNTELLKTPHEKRVDKLRNITKRIIKKPQAYMKMEADLRYWAKEYHTTIYELEDPRLEYPEEIIW